MRIKGLDSLRVFSIFIILIYHFFGNFMPAGFLGVNILFVMSGFLIMRNFLKEISTNDRIDLRRFYHKRFVRIVPAILLMLIIGLVFVNFVSKDYMQDLPRQVGATVSYTTNWYEIVNGGSYEAQFIKHIFLHTWFLALEIHFYIIVPLILVLTLFFFRKSRNRDRKLRIALKRLFIGIAIISYVVLLVSASRGVFSTAFNYFSDFTRMNSLFLGAALGTYMSNKKISKPRPLPALALLLVVTLFLSFTLNYADKKTYIVGFILVDFLTAFAIMHCCDATNLKEPKVISTISNYTYGIYIFHWPFLIMVSSLTDSIVKYPIIIVLTAFAVAFNQKIWEPVFRGEEPKIKNLLFNKKYSRAIMLSAPCMILILTVVAGVRGPSMLSLEKQIWEQSVSQDVQTIRADKENFEQSISKVSDYRIANRSEQLVINMPANLNKKGSTTLIGDSVMLGPKSYLEGNIPNLVVNAEGSRLLDSGPEVIRQLKKQNALGEIIVIALGTNVIADPDECLEKILKEIPKKKKVIFVTPYNGRDNITKVAEAMRRVAGKKKYITLMDWQKCAASNPDFYKDTDGIHFYGHMDTYAEYQGQLVKAIKKADKSKYTT